MPFLTPYFFLRFSHIQSRQEILRRLATVHSIEEFEKAFNVKLNRDENGRKFVTLLFIVNVPISIYDDNCNHQLDQR